jgi:long-chain acyl-CoA synthetase
VARLKDLAKGQPQKTAVSFAHTGETISYRALDEQADRVAAWLVSLGLEPGDTVAMLLENHPYTFEIWWGARRAGLYYTPISVQLTPHEAAYIVRDSEAKLVISSRQLGDLAAGVRSELRDRPDLRYFMIDGAAFGYDAYEASVAACQPSASPTGRPVGREFMYSSGTTGVPKGIRRALQSYEQRYDLPPLERKLREIFRFAPDSIFLNSSPLYHAISRFNIRAIECGGSCVILRKFDAETALKAIEQFGVTHSHWVPTMFFRLLALPENVRGRYDVSSMRCAIHAAAPCPPEIKEQMIAWWGPVIEEYYGGSENAGVTYINSADWLSHRGSVGRSITGEIHIVGANNEELPRGDVGLIYFSGGVPFRYNNDPEKTAAATNDRGWGTYGDMGYVDAEGYLYLSDRRADLIIVGGVNVYPKEIENVLLLHPAVLDVGVIGVPHPEYGEEIKAVVQLKELVTGSDALRGELLELCRERLAKVKWPRSIEFDPDLPRTDTGKLLRRILKDRYRC